MRPFIQCTRHRGADRACDDGAHYPIKIVIELQDEPAAIVYAATRQLRLAEALNTQVTRARIAHIEAAQPQVLSSLKSLTATILYRPQRVYNGVAAIVPADKVATIRQLPGVKAVQPLIGKTLDNWHSVPEIGAPQLWEGAGASSSQYSDRSATDNCDQSIDRGI